MSFKSYYSSGVSGSIIAALATDSAEYPWRPSVSSVSQTTVETTVLSLSTDSRVSWYLADPGRCERIPVSRAISHSHVGSWEPVTMSWSVWYAYRDVRVRARSLVPPSTGICILEGHTESN